MKPGFKPRVNRKYIGTYRPRIEAREKVLGRTQYIDDLASKRHFPDMLQAKVLRSPHPHARIKRLDVSRAWDVPGVVDILTCLDPEVASLKPTNCGWTDGADTVTYPRMYFPHLRDRKVLGDKACWVGDEVGVVVAAESERQAEEALERVEVEWEILPFVLDVEEALEPEAPLIHPDVAPENNILPPGQMDGPRVMVERGDVEQAFAEADVVVEARCRYHNPTHAVLENWSCLAYWEDDVLFIRSNTYEADQTRMHVSQMLSLPLNKVRVIGSYTGGSHGRGDNGEQTFFLWTSILSRRTGRPVKFRHNRREAFHDARTAESNVIKMGATRDGRITAVQLRLLGNAGAYAEHSLGTLKLVARDYIESSLGLIPALKVESDGVYTNKIPGSCMRGIGNIQLNWTVNLAVDMVAEKLGLDPIQLGPVNFNTEWTPLPNKGLEAILKEGARRIGWENRTAPPKQPVNDGSRRRGFGVSWNHSWHANWQEIRRGPIQVTLKVNPDGTVILQAPTIETGPGSNSCCAFACADALGVTLENVKWVSTVDTELGLKDQVQTDSAVSHILPEIIHLAASQAKEKILARAATEWETDAETLDLENNRVFDKNDPARNIELSELLQKGELVPMLTSVAQHVPDEITGVAYVATFAETEVDTAIGEVRVVKLLVINDCGTVMYATGAEAQQIGGQSLGLGESLYEELVYDRRTGHPLNFNMLDYKIPTMLDFPDIEPVPMEVWRGAGEFGACGIGESVLVCTGRAVANAVYNAVGVRINELPLSMDRVLQALNGDE